VPIYEYRCETDGLFDAMWPLGTAPESAGCPICGGAARRVISAPRIKSGSRVGLYAAIERSERSAHEPEVVTAIPSAGKKRRTPVLPLTPTLARLPRP